MNVEDLAIDQEVNTALTSRMFWSLRPYNYYYPPEPEELDKEAVQV